MMCAWCRETEWLRESLAPDWLRCFLVGVGCCPAHLAIPAASRLPGLCAFAKGRIYVYGVPYSVLGWCDRAAAWALQPCSTECLQSMGPHGQQQSQGCKTSTIIH